MSFYQVLSKSRTKNTCYLIQAVCSLLQEIRAEFRKTRKQKEALRQHCDNVINSNFNIKVSLFYFCFGLIVLLFTWDLTEDFWIAISKFRRLYGRRHSFV